jgi:hypothetical protein
MRSTPRLPLGCPNLAALLMCASLLAAPLPWASQAQAEPDAAPAPPSVPQEGEEGCRRPAPTPPDAQGFVRPWDMGCGVVSGDEALLKQVHKLHVVRLSLDPDATRVDFVLLDAQGRRLAPSKASITYEARFDKVRRGKLPLQDPKEGVFSLTLPKLTRAKPCQTHLYLRLKDGPRTLEAWVDDWLYSC